jgi:hypothetical protein
MAFQQDSFQPPVVGQRRFRRLREFRYHLKASPFVSLLEQDAWQRAYIDVPAWTKRKWFVVELFLLVIGGGFGLTLGTAWWERALLGAVLAAAFFGAGLVGLWLWRVAVAPRTQRDEAQRYARALEQQVADFREWGFRQQFAREFYDSEFQDAHAVEHNLRHFNLDEQAAHWKERLRNTEVNLRARGGGGYTTEVENAIRAFDNKEDGYGENQQRRLEWAIKNAAQNLWGVVRREEPPPSPARPGEEA